MVKPKSSSSSSTSTNQKAINKQTGGELSGNSKFNYDNIKLGKNMKKDNILFPSPPPTDCNIL